jgi:hypothetical protein
MPPKTRNQKKDDSPEKVVIKRRFVEVNKVSKYLYCSICMEVFNDPVQGPCQHTFCRQCIESYFGKAAKVNCPQCRIKIEKKNLRKNMLAYQLINDLSIFCSNNGCEWKGPLDEITIHLPNCTFGQGKLPSWFAQYMLSREEEFERE